MGNSEKIRFALPQAIEAIDSHVQAGVDANVVFNPIEDERVDGRTVRIDGQRLLNFGTCGYLGWEIHPSVRRGAIEAVERYGTQFSCSRAYLSLPSYGELEERLSEIFGAQALVAPSTTLAHLAALPVLIDDDDLVVLDQLAHASIQMAAQLLRARGVDVELVRHSHLGQLEARLQAVGSARRVWYVLDGVYSMFGDCAPLQALRALQDRYPALHLYIDDAHGMSWLGEHGRGFALSQLSVDHRTFVVTSLNKAFGAAGGALVFQEERVKQKVRRCGGPMLFSGPVQPPMLGAAVASAKLHLGPELPRAQAELQERIQCMREQLAASGLPVYADGISPIFFVRATSAAHAIATASRLRQQGVYLNPSTFPAVPQKCPGVRFTVTRHLQLADIGHMVERLADAYRELLVGESPQADPEGPMGAEFSAAE